MLSLRVTAQRLRKSLAWQLGYCSREVRHKLEGLIAAETGSNVTYEEDMDVLQTLHTLADEQISAVSFTMVAPAWLQLYMDTTLISAWLAGTEKGEFAGTGTGFWEAVIRRLDLALIRTGGRGDRAAWAIETIKAIQADFLAHRQLAVELDKTKAYGSELASGETSRKRQRIRQELEIASEPILSLAQPPTLDQYLQRHRTTPFIIRGHLNWKAISRWDDRGYIESVCGPGRVVPVEVGKAYTDPGWGQRIVPLSEFLDQIEGRTGQQDLYLAQHPLFTQFPDLEDDIAMPEYVTSHPGPTDDAPDYEPPDGGVKVNVWVGGGKGRVVSPAHTDPYYNCYAQVVGTKRVWLAPPRCTLHMHPPRQGSTADDVSTTSLYAANTSPFPILRETPEDWVHKPAARDFKEHVLAHSVEAVLNPGDLLVFPPGWWHAMRGENSGPGWSVSMWY